MFIAEKLPTIRSASNRLFTATSRAISVRFQTPTAASASTRTKRMRPRRLKKRRMGCPVLWGQSADAERKGKGGCADRRARDALTFAWWQAQIGA